MDLWTVVALVIVLHDQLPVRLDLVLRGRRGDQPLGPVVRDQSVQVPSVILESRSVPGSVGEHPAVPLRDAGRYQALEDWVGVGQMRETGRPLQSPIKAVD